MLNALFLFILGAIVGSFLNVVALRYNTGLGLNGRSSCAVCQKKLFWYELIPILSFIFLHARCSSCGAKISWQYPLVEIFTGVLFATVPFLLLPVFCLYVVILVYDLRHKIIPDALVYTAIVLAFLTQFFLGSTLWDFLAGPIFFVCFWLIWLISRGRAMGFGDAKLALSIGLLLGLGLGLSALALAFWIGTVFALGFMFIGKKLTMKSEIPFAPFLILGAWVALIYHLDLFHLL